MDNTSSLKPSLRLEKNPKSSGLPLEDNFGRTMKYLRISLTDRCNFKCTYCRPEVEETKRHEDLLTFEEIERIVSVMAANGVRKVRLTGGEPLLRKGADHLVRMISDINGIEDLAITTNAVMLSKYAVRLAAAGLDRLNISLDTLDPKRFSELTCGGSLKDALIGIDAAVEAGLKPIKLNTVLIKGFNDDELHKIIDYASERNFTARFIEFMPMSNGLDWEKGYISVDDVLKKPEIAERVDTSAARNRQSTASVYLPLKSGSGEVGFITPMSSKFCNLCNRLRITADGRLRACLPADDKDADLKSALRAGASDDELLAIIRKVVSLKPESSEYTFDSLGRKKSMVDIGG